MELPFRFILNFSECRENVQSFREVRNLESAHNSLTPLRLFLQGCRSHGKVMQKSYLEFQFSPSCPLTTLFRNVEPHLLKAGLPRSWKSHGFSGILKGWPAVRLAVVPKIGMSLVLLLLWSRRYGYESAPTRGSFSKSNWCVCRWRGHGILWYGHGKVMEFCRDNFVATL